MKRINQVWLLMVLASAATIAPAVAQNRPAQPKPKTNSKTARPTAPAPAALAPVPNEAQLPPPPANPAAAPPQADPPQNVPPAPKGDSNPKPAAGKSEEKEDPLVAIFGKGGMNLKSTGDSAKMDAETDSETGELTSMHITGAIILTSELMNLECEDIMIDMVKKLLVAKGGIVKFKKQEIDGICGRLTYEIDSKKTFLLGPPKPVINQKQTNGDVRRTSADRITMIQNDKNNNVLWDGNPELSVVSSGGGGGAKTGDSAPAKKPEKIDGTSVNKIRNPAVDGR